MAFPPESADRRDIGMIQRREQFGFPLETGNTVGILRKLFGQHLDRHIAPELAVLGLIHLTHASATKQGVDFEISQRCANHGERALQIGIGFTASISSD